MQSQFYSYVLEKVTMKHLHRNVLCTLALVLFASFVITVPAQAAANVSSGATLSIPSLKLQVQIIEAPQITVSGGFLTWDLATLGNRVAHLEGTAWTNGGADKNIVLAGHNTLPNGKPAIFYSLNRIHTGDNIMLMQGNDTFNYVVTRTVLVDPSSFDVVYPTGKDQLTLLTCAGTFSAKTGTYSRRLVVIAERIS